MSHMFGFDVPAAAGENIDDYLGPRARHAPFTPDTSEPLHGWMVDALCAQVDPEIFFPEARETNKAAKRVCAGCPVRTECLEYALSASHVWGVWGGLSETERRRFRHGRAA